MKFTEAEVQASEILVTASPLTCRLRQKLGARKLARLSPLGEALLKATVLSALPS